MAHGLNYLGTTRVETLTGISICVCEDTANSSRGCDTDQHKALLGDSFSSCPNSWPPALMCFLIECGIFFARTYVLLNWTWPIF